VSAGGTNHAGQADMGGRVQLKMIVIGTTSIELLSFEEEAKIAVTGTAENSVIEMSQIEEGTKIAVIGTAESSATELPLIEEETKVEVIETKNNAIEMPPAYEETNIVVSVGEDDDFR